MAVTKLLQRSLIVSLISISSCAGTVTSYSIDPVAEVMFNEDETIPFTHIECRPDPRDPTQIECPVVGIFADDFRTILEKLEACEENR